MSERVAETRPLSAWVLVIVASLTLWITQQLTPPVMAAQASMLGFSLWRRTNPHPLQSGPIFLNLIMMGITATTIAVALRGNPSSIALAHFAALTQGLQLLDVRPRKSEFLLVALALFQVILAANLTDSVFFPPLLVVFTISVTWTLMVHTLHTESLAAGGGESGHAAITPNLARSTAFVTIVAIGLAMVFFVTLPRMRTSMLRTGVGGSQALSGFSDNVELGSFGSIRKDSRVVLRVETLEGTPAPAADAYWRGLAFDTFDGRSWSISPMHGRGKRRPIPTPPRFGVDIAGGPSAAPPAGLVQRIIREPVASGVLFGSGATRRLEGALNSLEIDGNGGLYTPTQVEDRVQYTIWTRAAQPDARALATDRFAIPLDPFDPRGATRYLALPDLAPEVAHLASEIVRDARSDAARAAAIENWLRIEGKYTDSPGKHPEDDPRTPIEAFLLSGLSGHCEYFASSMVVLLRSQGIPARLVNGFAGGRDNALGGFVSVTRADAHAWVEVHYEDAGWVRYDPTPPDLRMRAAAGLGFVEQLGQVAEALETWWFRRIVEFDSADQIAALKNAFGMWKSFKGKSENEAGQLEDRWKDLSSLVKLSDLKPTPEGLALAAAGLFLLWLGFQKLRPDAHGDVPANYRRALRLLARHGHRRASHQAARDFAAAVEGGSSPLDAASARAFRRLTELYLAERFGGEPETRASSEQLDALERALARKVSARA